MDALNKVLVVDDEPIGRQLLEAILMPDGYSILFAENGRKALDIIMSELPDLILLDVMMPEMDGFEVCKTIRQNKATAHIPVFLITALDDRDSRIRGIDAGADDYISKPFDRLEILAKVKNSANLIRLRKQDNAGEVRPDSGGTGDIDRQVILSLPDILMKHQVSSKHNYNAYYSLPKNNSSHVFVIYECKEASYYFACSNNLENGNAAITNAILISLLKENSDFGRGMPSTILEQTLKDFKQIASDYTIALYKTLLSHIAIVRKSTNDNSILASGTDQTIFISNCETQDLTFSFLPAKLAMNQNTDITNSHAIFICSDNILKDLGKEKMSSVLNAHFAKKNYENIKEIIPDSISSSDDLLLVSLIF